jgi:hypothetical protein
VVSEEQRLHGLIEREPGEPLAIRDERGQTSDDIAVHRTRGRSGSAESDGLGGGVNVVTGAERGVGAVQDRVVKRHGERLSNVGAQHLHVVAGVGPNNFSRDDADRGQLRRLQRPTWRWPCRC